MSKEIACPICGEYDPEKGEFIKGLQEKIRNCRYCEGSGTMEKEHYEFPDDKDCPSRPRNCSPSTDECRNATEADWQKMRQVVLSQGSSTNVAMHQEIVLDMHPEWRQPWDGMSAEEMLAIVKDG